MMWVGVNGSHDITPPSPTPATSRGSPDAVRVLYVDADDARTGRVVDAFEATDERVTVVTETDPAAVGDHLAAETVHCVVTAHDWSVDGLAVLRSIRETRPALPVVLAPDAGSESLASDAIAEGVSDYHPTDADVASLAERVLAAVSDHFDADHLDADADTDADHLDADTDTDTDADRRLKERAVDEAPVGITVADVSAPGEPLVYVNDHFERVTGYSADECLGRNCRFLQGEETDRRPVAEMRRAIEAGESVSVELRNYRADGTPFWNHVDLVPVFDDAGDVSHYFGFQRDVTSRKAATTALQRNEERLRTLYDLSSDPALDFEEKLARLLDLGRAELGVGDAFVTRIAGERQRIVAARSDTAALQVGSSYPLDEAYCRKTIESDRLLGVQHAGESGWSDDPAYDRFGLGCYLGGKVVVDGDLFGTLCFADSEPREEPFTDAERTFVELLTQWLSYELSQRRTQRELERRNKRLDEFASVLSHDLRNPLNTAQGRLQLVAEECESEHVPPVELALDRMETLVDDILTLSREGKTIDDPTRLSLATVAERAWEVAGTEAAAFDATDATLVGDASRVQQLLENLFRNSLEHGTPEGHPEGDAHPEADDGPTVTVRVGPLDDGDGFFVADDGPGIPAEVRDHVLDSGFTTAAEGTGFGLAIVEQIADAHDWDVVVTEGPDGGARFEFAE